MWPYLAHAWTGLSRRGSAVRPLGRQPICRFDKGYVRSTRLRFNEKNCRRFFVSAILRSPGGFGAGNGSTRGVGGSSFAKIALQLPTRGEQWKRSRSIVSRSSSTRIGFVGIVEFRHNLIMRRERSDGKACGHRAEPDVAEQIEKLGAPVTVIAWASRLRCSACGERQINFVVSGASL